VCVFGGASLHRPTLEARWGYPSSDDVYIYQLHACCVHVAAKHLYFVYILVWYIVKLFAAAFLALRPTNAYSMRIASKRDTEASPESMIDRRAFRYYYQPTLHISSFFSYSSRELYRSIACLCRCSGSLVGSKQVCACRALLQ
jgi:hypothetical protein